MMHAGESMIMEQKRFITIVYTFFLGLLLAIFVGVGISAFYPSPKMPEYTISGPAFGTEPSKEEQAAQKKFEADMKAYNAASKPYNRNVSLIAMGLAVLLVVIGVVFSDRLRHLADGVMMGGLFTLMYSIGRSFASENTKIVFVVTSVGLAVVIYLGLRRLGDSKSTAKKSRTKRK
jgi:hypothetical protein